MSILSIVWLIVALQPTALSAQSASDVCREERTVGHWTNVRPDYNTLSKIEIIETCDPDGPYGNWKVRVFEKCAPRDCTWGWVRGEYDENGHMFAHFSTFIAERSIRLDPLSLRARVEVITNYRKPDRPDKRQFHILVKQAR